MKFKSLLKVFISILILGLLIWKIDFNQFLKALSRVSFLIYTITILHYIIALFCFNLNFFLLLKAQGLKMKFSHFFKKSTIAVSIGQFFPGRIGEVYIIKLLKGHLSSSKVISMYFLDKIISLIMLSLFSLIGIIFVFSYLFNFMIIMFLAFICLTLLLLLLLNKRIRNFLINLFFKKHINWFSDFTNSFKVIIKKPSLIFINISITLLRMLLTACVFRYVFLLFGVEIPIFYLMIINALSLIATLIPISMSGIGIKESVVVFLFGSLGYNVSIIIAIYLIVTFNQIIFSLLINILHFIFKR
jgi:glycosyltransferase 2 family protein